MPNRLDPPLLGDDHVRGAADAPHLLVEYADFECPYCQAAESAVTRVRTRMGDEVRVAFRHYPLDGVHPLARKAAEAAEAAAAQGRFWEMHDALFAARGALEEPDLLRIAGEVGLDVDRVAQELRDGVHAARVQRDVDSAAASGVTGTPSFFANGVLHEDPAFDARSLIDALRGD
jgi:Na+:H+ antiporter, NhaA family